jgi:hypothetical protein
MQYSLLVFPGCLAFARGRTLYSPPRLGMVVRRECLTGTLLDEFANLTRFMPVELIRWFAVNENVANFSSFRGFRTHKFENVPCSLMRRRVYRLRGTDIRDPQVDPHSDLQIGVRPVLQCEPEFHIC